MSSAFLQTSVYHWAKSTSRAVMASTCLLSCAIVSIPLLCYIIMYRAGRFSLNSYCIHSGPGCQLLLFPRARRKISPLRNQTPSLAD